MGVDILNKQMAIYSIYQGNSRNGYLENVGHLFIEIGVEELPAAHIPEAQTRLTTLFTEELKGQSLPFDEIKTYATPRRLTVVVNGLPEEQPTIEKSVRGPKYDAGFEADGSPKKAAIGFAQKNGIDVKDLAKEKVGDVEYIVANITIQGKKTAELLADIVPRVINHISGERLMRWGNSDFKFSSLFAGWSRFWIKRWCLSP